MAAAARKSDKVSGTGARRLESTVRRKSRGSVTSRSCPLAGAAMYAA